MSEVDKAEQRRKDAEIAANHPIGDMNPIQLRDAITLAILDQRKAKEE